MNSRNASPFRVLTPFILAGIMGLATGCDQTGDTEFRLREAREVLRVLNSGSGSAMPPNEARKLIGKVKSALGDVTKSDIAGEAAAAQVMIAEAQLVEAGLLLDTATDAGVEHARRLDELRGLVDIWREVSRRADQVASVKFDAEVADLQAQQSKRQTELAAIQKDLQALEARIRELHLSAEKLADEVDAERKEAGRLQLLADGEGAKGALFYVRQSQWHSRTADALEFKADEIHSEAQGLMPQMREREFRRDQATADIAALTAAAANLSAMQKKSAEEASRLRAEASKIAEQIDTRLFGEDGLSRFRDGTMTPAFSAAKDAYGQAKSAASQASSKSRGSGESTVARASFGVAGAAWNLAMCNKHYEAFLGEITAIPQYDGGRSPRMADELAKAEREREESVTAATEALVEATDSYGSAGGKDARGKLFAAHASNLLSKGAADLAGRPVDYAELIRSTRELIAAGREPEIEQPLPDDPAPDVNDPSDPSEEPEDPSEPVGG